jgi:phage gp45-like
MSDSLVKELGAKIRNIFSPGLFQKRYDDGKIQVKTYSGHVLEKEEAFPYGFTAKAKDGRALVFCIGGNFNSFEILPLIAGDKVKPPELEEGDAALYTESGGWITVRENGTVELFGKDAGGVVKADELKKQLDKLTARVDGIMDALKNSPTVPQDGGSSYKGAIAVKLATLVDKENFSKLESEKVLHGTGE